MPEITKAQTAALARVNARREFFGFPPLSLNNAVGTHGLAWFTLVAAEQEIINEREALATFRQEVSDRVYAACNTTCNNISLLDPLRGLIIPKPDPITEWLHHSGYEGNTDVDQAVRAYAAIKEQDDG